MQIVRVTLGCALLVGGFIILSSDGSILIGLCACAVGALLLGRASRN